MFRAMEGEADAIRPFWRTRLAPVLAAWMLLVVGTLLGSWRLAEIGPTGILAGVLIGVLVLSPAALLVWCLWALLRDPVTGWMAPSALLLFCGSMVPAFGPLIDAGARLNFLAHRPAYDAIVEEVRAGALLGRADEGGWVSGMRDGVRYRYLPRRTGYVEFVWIRDGLIDTGVRYNERPCRPTRAVKCVDAGQRLDGAYYHYRLIF